MTDTRQEMRDWLAAELDKYPRGIKGRLAAHIGVDASAIGRMLATEPGKETREIKAHEFVKMQEFFRLLVEDPGPADPKPQPDSVESGRNLRRLWKLFDQISGLGDERQEQIIEVIESRLRGFSSRHEPRAQSKIDG